MRLSKKLALTSAAIFTVFVVVLSVSERKFIWLDGLLFDQALGVRALIKGDVPWAKNVAVVSIDADTLSLDELKRRPRGLFGPTWAKLITALDRAGAQSINFDMIFEYSADQFRDEDGNKILRNFDNSFRRSLFESRSKLVLAYSAETLPASDYRVLLSDQVSGFGLINFDTESDGIKREVASQIEDVDGKKVVTFLGAAISQSGRSVGNLPEKVLIAPGVHPEEFIPSFKLETVLGCAKSDPEALSKVFKDRLVFVGWTGKEDDRIHTSARFISPTNSGYPVVSRCGLKPAGVSAPSANGLPGVFVWAFGAEKLLSGDLTTRGSKHLLAIIGGAAALVGTIIGFCLLPVCASILLLGVCLSLWGLEIVLLEWGIWFPAGWSLIGLVSAAVAAYVIRFLLEDKRRRQVQRAFSYYLSPKIVDELVDSPEELNLGGEDREITIMFADLSGFTALSTKLDPMNLLGVTNQYLGLITEEIEALGGYVDKYVGDAVMAIWGAPVASDDHADRAIIAAKAIIRRVEEINSSRSDVGADTLSVKIGINTGNAIVGNVGSKTRLNYTVLGEAVNIAARLESLPPVYGCDVVISDRTAEKLKQTVKLQKLDQVKVRGIDREITIFEPFSDG